MKQFPDFTREAQIIAATRGIVAGVDEVGRGPLAGPVTAAAVVLDPDRIPADLNDSKKLSAARRAVLAAEIERVAQISIASCSVEEIDRLNIRGASLLAMTRAIAGLPVRATHALIDGNALPQDMPCAGTCVIKGDALSLSIAAASIVAKVARDTLMSALDAEFPGYGWAKNAGYPTAQHLAALQHLGVTPHHRRSFGPVHKML